MSIMEACVKEGGTNVEEIFGRTDEDFCADIYDFYDEFCRSTTDIEVCCDEAADLYLERCDVEEDAIRQDVGICVVILLLIASFTLRSVLSGYNVRLIPEAGAAILVGILGGAFLKVSGVHDLSFSDSIFVRVALPPIILAATVALDKRAFRRNFGIIAVFAILGTLVATFVTGLAVYGLALLDGTCRVNVVESLLFGTAVSSIDPIAVLVVFQASGIRKDSPLYVALFGESVLNDGMVFLLFHLFLQFLNGVDSDASAIAESLAFYLLGVVGSIFLGLATPVGTGLLFKVLKGRIGHIMESCILVLSALLPYYFANALQWSGIVAIVFSGLAVEPYLLRLTKRETRRIFRVVLEFLSVVFETFVLAYVGVFMVLEDYTWCPVLLAGAVGACVLARAVHVFPACVLLNRYNTRRNLSRTRSLTNLASANRSFPPEASKEERPLSGGESGHLSIGLHSALDESLLTVDRAPATNPMSVTRESLSADDQARIITSAEADEKDEGLGPGFFTMFEAVQRLGVRDAIALSDVLRDESPMYSNADALMMWFAAMRGAVSFALIESLPDYDIIKEEGSRAKQTLVFLTSVIIILSVFLIGPFIQPLMKVLGIKSKTHDGATDGPHDDPMTSVSSTRSAQGGESAGNDDATFVLHGYQPRWTSSAPSTPEAEYAPNATSGIGIFGRLWDTEEGAHA